jgi:hypothetical protein
MSKEEVVMRLYTDWLKILMTDHDLRNIPSLGEVRNDLEKLLGGKLEKSLLLSKTVPEFMKREEEKL